MSAQNNLTKIIGIGSGIALLFSFFILPTYSMGIFGFSRSFTGWDIIRYSFDYGEAGPIIFALLLLAAVISALFATWFYYKDSLNMAMKSGIACAGSFVVALVMLIIKFESFTVFQYLGIGSWLSFLCAAGLIAAPKIHQYFIGIKPDNIPKKLSAMIISDPALKAEESVLSSKLQSDPLNIELLLKHGDVLLQSGMPEQAAQEWEKVVAIDKANYEALYKLCKLYNELGYQENAGKRFNQLSSVPFADIQQRIAYVELLQTIRPNPELAAKTLLYGLKDDPDNIELLSKLLDIYHENENMEAANETARRIMEMSPDDFNALLILAEAIMAKGQFEEASKLTGRARELRPKSNSVALLDNFAKLYLSGPDNVKIHEAVLKDLELIDNETLNSDELKKLGFVLAVARVALKKGTRRDNDTIIAYLNSHPQQSKYYSDFIVVCYEIWAEASVGQASLELLDYLISLYQSNNFAENKVLLAEMYSRAGKYYQKESAWKSAAYYFKKAIELAPSNENLKKQLTAANSEVKNRKRKLQFVSLAIVIIIFICVVGKYAWDWNTEKDYFDSVKSSIYPEQYTDRYPDGRYVKETNYLRDSLDYSLNSVQMAAIADEVLGSGSWRHAFNYNGAGVNIVQLNNGGYVLAYQDVSSVGKYRPRQGIKVIFLNSYGKTLFEKYYQNELKPYYLSGIESCADGGFVMACGRALYKISNKGETIWVNTYEYYISNMRKGYYNDRYILYIASSNNNYRVLVVNDEGNSILDTSFDLDDTRKYDLVSFTSDNRNGMIYLYWATQSLESKYYTINYIVRYDSLCNKSWDIIFDENKDLSGAICTTRDGGYLVAGLPYLIKLDYNGQIEWKEKTYLDSTKREDRIRKAEIVRLENDLYNILIPSYSGGSSEMLTIDISDKSYTGTKLDAYCGWNRIIQTADNGILYCGNIRHENYAFPHYVFALFKSKPVENEYLPIELTTNLIREKKMWSGKWDNTPVTMNINETKQNGDTIIITGNFHKYSGNFAFSGTLKGDSISLNIHTQLGKYRNVYDLPWSGRGYIKGASIVCEMQHRYFENPTPYGTLAVHFDEFFKK